MKLDAGRNDYYGHGQGCWDLRNSAWLAHLDAPQQLLSVSLGTSTGGGRVTSNLPGIACPPGCSSLWDTGAQVTLTATPAEGSRFAGWSGACSSDPCAVTMSAAQTAVASFAAQVRLNVAVRRAAGARGTVTSSPSGISCPPSRATTLDRGRHVRLVATRVLARALQAGADPAPGRRAARFR